MPNQFKENHGMPIVIKDQTYYRTRDVCQMVGVSRSTLLRWISSGLIKDTVTRDRRGWRLFTEADIKRIEDEAYKVNQVKPAKVRASNSLQ
jgi:excisionase family DNA binding protein